jgi:hypothetical protein
LRRRLGVRQGRLDAHVTVYVYPFCDFPSRPLQLYFLSLLSPGEQSCSKERPKERPRSNRQPFA